MRLDTVEDGFAVMEYATHGLMAVVASGSFSYPVPKILNRVEVRIYHRQRYERKAKTDGGSLY